MSEGSLALLLLISLKVIKLSCRVTMTAAASTTHHTLHAPHYMEAIGS